MRFAISAAVLLILASFIPASSQVEPKQKPGWENRDLEGFSLTGGVANMIEGDVSLVVDGVVKQPGKARERLLEGSLIQLGDGARAEILLNPGYYLRLSHDAEVSLLDLSRENLKFKLFRGSAILEVAELANSNFAMVYGTGIPDEYLIGIYPPITVITPQGELATTRGGIYRFDVDADGNTELKVVRGLAVVSGNRIKDGMRVCLQNGKAMPASFNNLTDAFDTWSGERAAALLKANKAVRNSAWHTYLRNHRFSFVEIKDDDWVSQANERHTVSAMGGIATFVEEGVAVKSSDDGWKELVQGTGLSYGDRVRTGGDARVEVLPYPTCFLHLARDTEIIYSEKENGGLAIEVVKGSAMVQSELSREDQGLISLVGPHGEYEIIRNGVYRLNVLPDGASEIIVWRRMPAGAKSKRVRKKP
jgi:hypothetical protein